MPAALSLWTVPSSAQDSAGAGVGDGRIADDGAAQAAANPTAKTTAARHILVEKDTPHRLKGFLSSSFGRLKDKWMISE
jgi:hypothetical protein